ncbi:MAG: hypothetical protein F6K41_18260 [Symploca sp. SIO3E6]|nr:hypothetical protein [Caldora sp. SIO3E6]
MMLCYSQVYHEFKTTAKTVNHHTPSNSIEPDKWQHLAISNDGTTAKIYINGELKEDTPVGHPLVVNKNQFRIGGDLEGQNRYWFKGHLTEIRLWNKVRTETEIKDNLFNRLKGDEDGLAGYWPLNNVVNNVASDETDNENHGKVFGAIDDEQFPLITTGKSINDRQYVLRFDGSGDYVQVDEPPSPTDTITVSCWAKSKTPKWNGNRQLVSKQDVFELGFKTNSTNLEFCIYVGNYERSTEIELTSVDITKWHHYAGTFDGKILRLYVDGTEVNNTVYSGTLAQNAKPMYIGSSYYYNKTYRAYYKSYFCGKIAEVQVWDQALTLDEIQKTMTHKLSGYEEDLMGYWPLDKGYGNIATDETLRDAHGVIFDAVWDEQLPIGLKPPVVEVDLSTWTAENYDNPSEAKAYTKPNPAEWDVAADGKSVTQTQDALQGYFFSDFTTKGHTILAKLTVTTGGKNYIGFALNFNPGDTTSSSADFILLNWNARDSYTLKLSSVKGKKRFIDYTKLPDAVPGEKAATLSSTKWVASKTYQFKFERKNSKLQIWIDGSLEFDLDDTFPDGRFACFAAGQRNVVFSDIQADI